MSLPESRNVLVLEGEIDLSVAPGIAAALGKMTDHKALRLVVDLSDVTYIDSSGLAVLIGAMQNAEEYGGKVVLAGLQESVQTIFEAAKLDQFFIFYSHVDAALAAV